MRDANKSQRRESCPFEDPAYSTSSRRSTPGSVDMTDSPGEGIERGIGSVVLRESLDWSARDLGFELGIFSLFCIFDSL